MRKNIIGGGYYDYWDQFVKNWINDVYTKPDGLFNSVHSDQSPDYSGFYVPEPWWGNDGENEEPLYSVCINLNPGEAQSPLQTRKNPGVIVKIVDSSVINSERAVKALYESLRSREGWAAIDAVKNRRILLLSQELLAAPYLQTAVLVMIAKTAYPALLFDVDLDHMLEMLMEEATGTIPAGGYYSMEDSQAHPG